jgi:hypothetical protein
MKSAAHRGLVIAVICLAALIIILWHLVPVAHDREHPELDSWYRALHADDGAWCCDGADANHLADVDWESHDGHYRVRVDGRWWVPTGAVISAPNRDSRAMAWMNGGYQGHIGVRCFSMT